MFVVCHASQEGFTPLHYALQDSSRLVLALLLVSAGADPLHRATGGGGDRPIDRAAHVSHKLSLLRAAVNVGQDRLAKLESKEAAGGQWSAGQPPESPHTPQLARVRTGALGTAERPFRRPQRAAEEGGGGEAPAGVDDGAEAAEAAPDVPGASTPAAAAAAGHPHIATPEPSAALSVAAARKHLNALREELAALEDLLPRSAASETDIPSPRVALSTGRTPSTVFAMRKVRRQKRRSTHFIHFCPRLQTALLMKGAHLSDLFAAESLRGFLPVDGDSTAVVVGCVQGQNLGRSGAGGDPG